MSGWLRNAGESCGVNGDLAPFVTAGKDRRDAREARVNNLCIATYVAACILLSAGLIIISAACLAQQTRVESVQRDGRARDYGERSFIAYCSTCHGLDGRGGEHAPGIVNTAAARARSDQELGRIIRNGIPGAGMPSFHTLTNQQIEAIISYLRLLRGGARTVAVIGDPGAGAKLFFGRAQCSECHMMHGSGGFIGSDLSDFGRTHSAADILQIILQPNKALVPRWQLVNVLTHGGKHFSGLVRNEDNFSIALLSEDGVFHLLMKSEIASISREPRSIMPDDYGNKLDTKQLDDIVAYIILGSTHKSPRTNGSRD